MKQMTVISTALLAVLAAGPALAQAGAGSPGTGPGGMGDSTGMAANPSGMPGTTNTINNRMFGATPTAGTTGSGLNTINSASTTGVVGTNNLSGSANWDSENTYWQKSYSSRPYYSSGRGYTVMQPAFQYGVNLYNQNPNAPYASLNQTQLENGWNQARGTSSLSWSQASPAVQDAYEHLYNANNATGGSASSTMPAR